MSDYELLMVILTFGLILIGVIDLHNKKQPSASVEGVTAISVNLNRSGEVHSPFGCPVEHIITHLSGFAIVMLPGSQPKGVKVT